MSIVSLQKELPRVSSDAPILKISQVSKSYDVKKGAYGDPTSRHIVLDQVSLDAAKGEFISLLGASGCGKTTLLKMIAGLTTPDSGSIFVDGRPVVAPRKDLCLVFQNFGLLPWRSVLSNVAFPLELDGAPRKRREEVAIEYLNLVGLTKFQNHHPHELSGGMQQRVGIARALVRNPLVLLMDEPFGALDAQTREQLQDDFLKIWTKLKTTVIFVTHSIDEALVLSDKIIVLQSNPGRIAKVLQSSVAQYRMGRDVRAYPSFGEQSHEIRELLRPERET
jgi:NitT/TauT family transport system ATP-binding protein